MLFGRPTAVLALFTYHYTEAATKQVEATNRQVKALTNPILNVDIQIIEGPVQNVVGVSVPEALEVFIQNVGPGNACEITFDIKEKDDFSFLVGGTVHKFIDEIVKNSVTRLAPGQRWSLAIIILSENALEGILSEITKNEVTLMYKNATGDSFTESYLLDFSYNFELIKTLSNIQYSTLHTVPRADTRPKTPAHSAPILDLTRRDLTERENEFLRSIYDCVKEDDISRNILREELNTLAEKVGLNEHDVYRYTMLLKAFGLIEARFLRDGRMLDLKLASNGVLYARRLRSE